jgi:esterase/lipase superfamily enzyme
MNLRPLALLLPLAVLTGCSLKMMASPVIFTTGEVDPFADLSAADRTPDIRIFYATDRAFSGPATDRSYRNGRGEALRLGEATLRLGGRETTWGQLYAASITARRKTAIPITLENATELGVLADPDGKQAFADAINRELGRHRNPDIIIYVHGAALDFYKACAETAQLAHFLARESVVIAFAWPTRQSVLFYPLDKKEAQESVPNLVALLEFLAADTDAGQLHILGYSAGGPLLARSLVQLDRDRAQKIGTVIFTASDDDLRTFATDELKHFHDLPRRIEVTVSEHDDVLILSRIIHMGASRVGDPQLDELTPKELAELKAMSNLDVIDVTWSPRPRDPDSYEGKFTGHHYWYENSWVSTDVIAALRFGLRAHERGLVQREGHKAYYFPHDYPQRVVRVIRDAAGAAR